MNISIFMLNYVIPKYICNEVDKYGKKEAGTGEHLTHLIIIKTNTNEKRQPLTDDCRTQNTN